MTRLRLVKSGAVAVTPAEVRLIEPMLRSLVYEERQGAGGAAEGQTREMNRSVRDPRSALQQKLQGREQGHVR